MSKKFASGLGMSFGRGMAGVVVASVAGISAGAFGAVLVPTQTYFFIGADAEGVPAGTVIKNQTDPFAATDGVFSGTIQSEVIVDSFTHNDDFVYQISNSNSSHDPIDRLSLDSFAGFTTDVGYVSGNTDPFFADRSADGSTVGFNFDGNEISPNTSSDFLVVKTNSTSWTEGNGSLIDGGSGSAPVTVPTFTLMTHVPEPTTAAILSIGSGMLMVRRRRN